MTNYYQGTSGFSQPQSSIPQQAIFQQGFAGTDTQTVRQQNAQSIHNQYGGGYQQSGQYVLPTMGGGGFGVQTIFQPGFAGTDAQTVRQQNAQSVQNQYGGGFQPSAQYGIPSQGYGTGQFTGPQAVFQPGFAGTNTQVVRQQNSQSAQGQFGGYQQSGPMGNVSFGGGFGTQAVFQPGFAGTDAQVVRQQNAQSAQNQLGNAGYQQAGPTIDIQPQGISPFSGPQAVFQPGFAGTDAQVVRQQNAQPAQNQFSGTGFQQHGQSGMTSMGYSQFGGPQAAFQQGFAGTNVQEVRQQNSQSLQNRSSGLNQLQ